MKGDAPTKDPTKLVMTLRQPRGVYAVVTPSNYPVNIPVEDLRPGLATGEYGSSGSADDFDRRRRLMRAIEAAGLPAGVLNLVIGEGRPWDEIVSRPDTAGSASPAVSATGGTSRSVARAGPCC